ncbi:MAG: C45 family peptidase [Bacteroidota bacterium]
MGRSQIKRGLLKWLIALSVVIFILVLLFRMAITIHPPEVDETTALHLQRVELGRELYQCDESWLKKNGYGLWEMYLQGSDFELGVKHGILAREQIHYQEQAFVSQLREMVPSDLYIRFLKKVVVWMNRNLDRHIPDEYQREIYGVALQASDTFSFIGPAYQRILNYHAAHDIGHALQNMNLVACTAMGVNGSRSKDGRLLVGRNFDFSMGDDFARNKILAFFEPDSGYRFASVTWGGMIGVVSGMNDQGLVVTLNAAKSGIPGSAKTPTSILARQILQYASNIDEAMKLAQQSETFVAESFLVSSARDNRTVVIEKSPDGLALYDPQGEEMILTNHFQSEQFSHSRLTIKNRAEGASVYRWERTAELMELEDTHDVSSFIRILRDQNGMDDTPIGMGNEKAVNQLVAHHSVVFEPDRLRMWISTFPYQLGAYLCYDLERVFSDTTKVTDQIHTPGLLIGEDPFLSSEQFLKFKAYRHATERIRSMIDEGALEEEGESAILDETLDEIVKEYLKMNPRYYYPYFLAGEVCRIRGDLQRATELYEASLSLEIPRMVDREQILEAKASLPEK